MLYSGASPGEFVDVGRTPGFLFLLVSFVCFSRLACFIPADLCIGEGPKFVGISVSSFLAGAAGVESISEGVWMRVIAG